MGDAGDDAVDATDFQAELVIEKNVPAVDEVEEMVKIAKQSTYNKKQLFANLYELVCCMAFDQITQAESIMPSMELWTKCAVYFHEIMANLHLKEEARDKLFRHFEKIDSWPAGFELYIADYSQKSKIPESFLNSNTFTAGLSASCLQTVYFGSLVQQRYIAAKRFIGCQCIPYWKEPHELDSGEELWALLLAIRKTLWPAYCQEKAREAINLQQRNAKKQVVVIGTPSDPIEDITPAPLAKKMKTPLVVLPEAEKNAAIVLKKNELLRYTFNKHVCLQPYDAGLVPQLLDNIHLPWATSRPCTP